ncbi:MAG TPA: hypothetical protein VK469_09400 [Candidatus Kapabacteria bacterium]|nr:hypothetical protein [Candidatus Kapabacteria bacterium]
MELDFTFNTLKKLYAAILASDYEIVTFAGYLQGKYRHKAVILRHDVDRFVTNALKIALLEKEMGVQASYYFRYKKGLDHTVSIMKEISRWGHEVGYHYEVLAKTGGDRGKAVELFREELKYFREHVEIKTICMHGSPLSPWDSRKIWETYNYKDLDLLGEPYFDVDFSRAAYLTDTGRKWNTRHFNIRDQVNTSFKANFKNTGDIGAAFQNHQLPGIVMINIHPHRWHDSYILWMKEWGLQNSKNRLKHILKKTKIKNKEK